MAMSVEEYREQFRDPSGLADLLEREIDRQLRRWPPHKTPHFHFSSAYTVPVEAEEMVRARFRLAGWELHFLHAAIGSALVGVTLVALR